MPPAPPRPRLVVPVDFSPASIAAARFGQHLAERAGAELHLLHIARQEGSAKEAKERLASFAGEAGLSLTNITLAERHGAHPAPCIVEYADEVTADLVVMSRVGGRGLRRYLIGSQTDEVLRTISCKLLVLPETLPATPHVHHLLVPVDLTPLSAPLVHAARTFAARYGDAAHVTVMHALEPLPHAGGWMSGLALHLDDSLGASIEAEVRTLAEGAGGPEVPLDVRVTEGKAAEAILRTAESVNSDLIVLTSHGREYAQRFLIGSVTERVVRTADQPVLVVQPWTPQA